MPKGKVAPRDQGTVVDSCYMEHTSNGHSKWYLLEKWQINEWLSVLTFHLSARYGKIGNQGTTVWLETNQSGLQVNRTFNEVKTSKLAKGYKIAERKSAVKADTTPSRPVNRFSILFEE